MLLVHFIKAFPLTLLGHSFERRASWLLFCFESYEGIPYSYTGKVDRGWGTLKINPNVRGYSFLFFRKKTET